MKYNCVFLDAGHGGIDPKTGKYTTAPNKMFIHSKGEFHRGRAFYEGVFNRKITVELAQKLYDHKIPIHYIHHDYLDYSLKLRVSKINHLNSLSKGILVSNHSNASVSHIARGWEIYSTPGKTESDTLAQRIAVHAKSLLPVKFRYDLSDGDLDKEARFYILNKTSCPSVLVENLFFDNYEDAKLLMQDEMIDLLAEVQLRGILDFMHS